jgi:hypothetical protein
MESLGFEWDCLEASWERRLSELAKVSQKPQFSQSSHLYIKNTKLGKWVAKQGNTSCRDGKKSQLTALNSGIG